MSMRHRQLAAVFLAALAVTLSGCSQPAPVQLQHLAPDAPAAAGLLPLRPPDQPSPLKERPPFGLYAAAPTDDTLSVLSTGTLSPDRRFRAVSTDQGAWVARVDGAWLWQLQLPMPPGPPAPPPGTHPFGSAPQAPPAAQSKPPKPWGPVTWTPVATLLLQDEQKLWYEADPATAEIRALAPFFRGKEALEFSADGLTVRYFQPVKTGRQLWVAKIDGTGARLISEEAPSKQRASSPVGTPID